MSAINAVLVFVLPCFVVVAGLLTLIPYGRKVHCGFNKEPYPYLSIAAASNISLCVKARRRYIDLLSVCDYLLSCVLSILLIPMFILVFALLYAKNASFPIVGTPYVGKRRRQFILYKFNIDKLKSTDTSYYMYIKAISMLPVYINLLKGDISLIGITCIRECLYKQFTDQMIRWYDTLLLEYKPGVISVVNVINVFKPERFFEYNFFFIEHDSFRFRFDLLIAILSMSKLGSDVQQVPSLHTVKPSHDDDGVTVA